MELSLSGREEEGSGRASGVRRNEGNVRGGGECSREGEEGREWDSSRVGAAGTKVGDGGCVVVLLGIEEGGEGLVCGLGLDWGRGRGKGT